MTGEVDTHIRDVLRAKMTNARPQPGRLITHLHRVKHSQVTQNAKSIRSQILLSINYFCAVVIILSEIFLDTNVVAF